MRVLHLVSGALYGGVETFLCTLARHAKQSPMAPQFAVCFEGRLSQELTTLGAQVHVLGPTRFRNPVSLMRSNTRLARLLRRERFDAVVTHGQWPHVVFGPQLILDTTRWVTWGHGAPLNVQWIDRLANALPPDLLIANSEHTVQAFGSLFESVPKAVIRYPVEDRGEPLTSSERSAFRKELGVAPDELVILFAARLERWKGHHLLLSAAAELVRQGAPKFHVLMCGAAQRPSEIEYERELREFTRRERLGSVVSFLGERRDVPRLMSAADVFCQPNCDPEPFGIVFVEALYAGLPVVATAMGGALEIVDATCGLLAEPNAAAVASALSELLTNPEKRRLLGAQAPRRAAELCEPLARIRELSDAIAKL